MEDPAKQVRTIHGWDSPMYMHQIHNEFGRGHNLGAYRGVQWWTDGGATGHFSSTNLGMSQFFGARATSPAPQRGITEFNYMGIGGSNDVMSYGADNPYRYIVVAAINHSTANATNNLAGCTINGVNLPLIVANVNWSTANAELIRVALFGGYMPSGASGSISVTLPSGTATTGYRAVYRLVGANIVAHNPQAGGASAVNISVPASSVFLGVAGSPDNSGGIGWTNLTAAAQQDAGGWQAGTGYHFTGSAETRSVNRSKGTAVFAGFG